MTSKVSKSNAMVTELDRLCFQVKDILRNYGKQQTAEGTMTAEVIMEYLIFIKFFEAYSPELHGDRRLKVYERMVEQDPELATMTLSSFMEPYIQQKKGGKSLLNYTTIMEQEMQLHDKLRVTQPTIALFDDTMSLYIRLAHDECAVKILEAIYLSTIKLDDVGDIHEYFIQDEAKSKSKMYGQFFTPNEICMKAMELVQPKLREDGSIPEFLDPAAGSFKFMRTAAKHLVSTTGLRYEDILLNHCYGCEIEKKAYRSLLFNIVMETGDLSDNVFNANSLKYLMYGKLLHDNGMDAVGEYDVEKKYDYIFANPPFGCKTELEMIQQTRDEKVDKKTKMIGKFQMKTKNTDGMFLQLIIHLLKDGGEACIVMCGSIFNKDWVALRKYWMETCDIKSITVCPKDSFKNTSIESYLIHFKKGVSTSEVVYYHFTKGIIGTRMLFDENYDLSVIQTTDTTHISSQHIQKKIVDISTIETGTYITKANAAQLGAGYPIYGGGNKGLYNSTQHNREDRLVIAKDGVSANCVRFVQGKFHLNHHGWTLKCNESMIEKFLYYQLKAYEHRVYKLADGAAQKGITMDDFNNLDIVVPPIDVQQQLVAKLETLDNNINVTKQKIEADKEYMKILFEVETRGYEQVRFGDVCEFHSGKTRNTDEGKAHGQYPLFSSSLQVGYYIDTYDYNVESIIVNTINAVGKCNVHISSQFSRTSNTLMFRSSDEEKVLTQYIYMFMKMNLNDIEKLYMGTTKKKLNKSDLIELKVSIVDIEKQHSIVSMLNKKLDSILALEAELNEYANMKGKIIELYISA